eukprot:gene5398-7482_t
MSDRKQETPTKNTGNNSNQPETHPKPAQVPPNTSTEDSGEWGWDALGSEDESGPPDAIDSNRQIDEPKKDHDMESLQHDVKHLSLKKETSDKSFPRRNSSLSNVQNDTKGDLKGITSSPSFQELEKAIGMALHEDQGEVQKSLSNSYSGTKLSSMNVTQQKVQQQRMRQQMQHRYNNSNGPMTQNRMNQYNNTPSARSELSPFINEVESRAIILFHSPAISPVVVKNACSKFGVLYYIRPEFHGRGVTLISYFDLRAATNAKTTITEELGNDSDSSAHYSVMLHAAAEEFRLIVRNLPDNITEGDFKAIFARYGQIRNIQKLTASEIEVTNEDPSQASVAQNKDESEDIEMAYSVEYYNIQDARVAASELSATSVQVWGLATTVKFAPLESRKQQLCRQLLATISRWRNEMSPATNMAMGLPPIGTNILPQAMNMNMNMNQAYPARMMPPNHMINQQNIFQAQQNPGMDNVNYLQYGGSMGVGLSVHPQQMVSAGMYDNRGAMSGGMVLQNRPPLSGGMVATNSQMTPPVPPLIYQASGVLPMGNYMHAGPNQGAMPSSQQPAMSNFGLYNNTSLQPQQIVNPLGYNNDQSYFLNQDQNNNRNNNNLNNNNNNNNNRNGQYTNQNRSDNQGNSSPNNYSDNRSNYSQDRTSTDSALVSRLNQPPSDSSVHSENSNFSSTQSFHSNQQQSLPMTSNSNYHHNQAGPAGQTGSPMNDHNQSHHPMGGGRPQHHNGGYGHNNPGGFVANSPYHQNNSNGSHHNSNRRVNNKTGSHPSNNLSNAGGNDADFALDLSGIVDGTESRTTIMVRNIPNKYNQQMLLDEVNVFHEGTYDFFYLPIDFKNRCNVGYCFINFLDPKFIAPFVKEFNGQRWKSFNSEKICAVSFARIQGKNAMIARFQNSSLLEKDDEYQPLLFYSNGLEKGKPEPFPSGNRRNVPHNNHGNNYGSSGINSNPGPGMPNPHSPSPQGNEMGMPLPHGHYMMDGNP